MNRVTVLEQASTRVSQVTMQKHESRLHVHLGSVEALAFVLFLTGQLVSEILLASVAEGVMWHTRCS